MTPLKNIQPLYIHVHTCTIMYMNINEFRKTLKSCFDSALSGNAVLIERGGVQYKLVADVVVFKKPINPPIQRNARMTTYDEKNAGLGESVELPPTPIKNAGLCPHEYAKGLCKKADCNRRYA